jgi:hypothetical protein
MTSIFLAISMYFIWTFVTVMSEAPGGGTPHVGHNKRCQVLRSSNKSCCCHLRYWFFFQNLLFPEQAVESQSFQNYRNIYFQKVLNNFGNFGFRLLDPEIVNSRKEDF